MSLRDFLERFRPAGTPGASATGVPADRAAERAAELEPALARLTRAQQEADRIRAEADEAAKAVREDAAREAARLVAAAREQAPEVRRRTAEPLLDRARQEADAVRAAGDSAAAAVRARAAERMPGLVERAVADALRLPARGPEGTAGHRDPDVPEAPGGPAGVLRSRGECHERTVPGGSADPEEPAGPTGPSSPGDPPGSDPAGGRGGRGGAS